MSIEALTPKKGEISFVWFNNYAGVVIKTPSKTFVVDPVDVDSKAFKTVDVLLVTHEHYDHLSESIIRDIHNRTQCLVIADPTSFKRLRDTVASDKLRETRVGSEHTIDDILIRAESSNHPPATTPLTYMITSEDGVRIYHTADSLPFPEMRRIGEQYRPDVVFCTVAIAPGASPRTGVEIAKMIQPKLAVPYHTATNSDLNRFAEILSKEAPNIPCKVIERGKSYTYP
jgi:L-ascorbate metabolism protein UlaG (beta-lactamase superfamily)